MPTERTEVTPDQQVALTDHLRWEREGGFFGRLAAMGRRYRETGEPQTLETPPPADTEMPDHEVRETGETTDG